MKKLILSIIFLLGAFKLNAMGSDSESDDDLMVYDSLYTRPIRTSNTDDWAEAKQKLFKLGMTEEDLDQSASKDPLEKLKLTKFWKDREKISQGGKNELLAKILRLDYGGDESNLQRLHVASAVMIGANVNTKVYDQVSGDCALSWACIRNDINLASFLLQHGADPNYTKQALTMACFLRAEKIARLLLFWGADHKKQLEGRNEDERKWCQNIQSQMQKE